MINLTWSLSPIKITVGNNTIVNVVVFIECIPIKGAEAGGLRVLIDLDAAAVNRLFNAAGRAIRCAARPVVGLELGHVPLRHVGGPVTPGLTC